MNSGVARRGGQEDNVVVEMIFHQQEVENWNHVFSKGRYRL